MVIDHRLAQTIEQRLVRYIKKQKLSSSCQNRIGQTPILKSSDRPAQRYFYDQNFMDYLSCYPQYISKHSLQDVSIYRGRGQKVLSSGRHGETQTFSDLYVIKVPLDDADDLKLEFAVGDVLNQAPVPNFVHTFSFVQDDRRNYVIMEYVRNAKTFRDFLLEGNYRGSDLISIVLQVLFSLWIANDRFGFVHNDLLPMNILILSLQEPQQIPYLLPTGETLFVTTRYVAKIIDFGMSNINLGTKSKPVYVGPLPGEYKGDHTIRYDMHSLISDVYKFFSFVIYIKGSEKDLEILSVLLEGIPEVRHIDSQRNHLNNEYIHSIKDNYYYLTYEKTKRSTWNPKTFYQNHLKWFIFDYLQADYVRTDPITHVMTCDAGLIRTLEKKGAISTQCLSDDEMEQSYPYQFKNIALINLWSREYHISRERVRQEIPDIDRIITQSLSRPGDTLLYEHALEMKEFLEGYAE